jgi:hypothetical protein
MGAPASASLWMVTVLEACHGREQPQLLLLRLLPCLLVGL